MLIRIGPSGNPVTWRQILSEQEYIASYKVMVCPSDESSNQVDPNSDNIIYVALQSYGINLLMDMDINENTTDNWLHGDGQIRSVWP